jgi:hypothetical protein
VSRVVRLTLAAALLIVGVGSVAAHGGAAGQHESPSSPGCSMALTVGLVPGRVDKVWLLRCITALHMTPS